MFYYKHRKSKSVEHRKRLVNYGVVSNRGGGVEDALAASERGGEAIHVQEIRAHQRQLLCCSIQRSEVCVLLVIIWKTSQNRHEITGL